MVLLEHGAQKADASLKKIGSVSYNPKTGHRHQGKPKNGETRAGPLWIADTSDKTILKTMKKNAPDEKSKTIIETLQDETGFPPYFFDVHHLVSGKSPKMDYLLADLKEKGFNAARTHYAPTGIKTNASIQELQHAMKKS
jgi:tRNA (guanine26-N2/guanine27-N2)-dimethyltransferase